MMKPPERRYPKAVTRQRNFFQLHLSTSIVLMIVTGALVGANVPYDAVGQKSGLIYIRQGWPCCFFADWHREDPTKQQAIIEDWFDKHPDAAAAYLIHDIKDQEVEHGLRYDITIAAAIFLSALVVAEWIARYADWRRKPVRNMRAQADP